MQHAQKVWWSWVNFKQSLKNEPYRFSNFITERGYAKHGICRRRVSVCLSVCVSVCLSHSGIVSQRLNIESRK